MPNTINKKVSCFRKLRNLAAMEGYNKNAVSLRVWKDRTIKEIDKRAEIYLTDEEIDAMYDMELTGEKEIVRDIFLLGYFSCQRYSDYCKFTENERKWFHKLDKWAKIRNGSPLWERNKHGEVVRAKYELICSHTARRSGTTNLYKLGVLSDLELRSITGHESQKNFEGYIRIGISEQAQRVGDKIKAAMEARKRVDK